jgi:hypothetical protein
MVEGALASKEGDSAAFSSTLENALRKHLPAREYRDSSVC